MLIVACLIIPEPNVIRTHNDLDQTLAELFLLPVFLYAFDDFKDPCLVQLAIFNLDGLYSFPVLFKCFLVHNWTEQAFDVVVA